jgi:hypothetical protein
MEYATGTDLERRHVLAQAFAREHGQPLGFFDEEDQHQWDEKARAVLRELDSLPRGLFATLCAGG